MHRLCSVLPPMSLYMFINSQSIVYYKSKLIPNRVPLILEDPLDAVGRDMNYWQRFEHFKNSSKNKHWTQTLKQQILESRGCPVQLSDMHGTQNHDDIFFALIVIMEKPHGSCNRILPNGSYIVFWSHEWFPCFESSWGSHQAIFCH